jgi:predicted PurR-regulated permease PerM
MTVLYMLLGVRFALGLGVIAALLEFVPILGQAILMGITLVVTIFQPDNWLGLNPFLYAGLVLVAVVVVQQIHSNVITPRIVGQALELHPIAMLVGVIIGTSIWGILGAILAAPLLATAKLFGTYVWRKMFDLPPFDGLPDESPPTRPSLTDRLTQKFEAQLDEARAEERVEEPQNGT